MCVLLILEISLFWEMFIENHSMIGENLLKRLVFGIAISLLLEFFNWRFDMEEWMYQYLVVRICRVIKIRGNRESKNSPNYKLLSKAYQMCRSVLFKLVFVL